MVSKRIYYWVRSTLTSKTVPTPFKKELLLYTILTALVFEVHCSKAVVVWVFPYLEYFHFCFSLKMG